MTIMAYHAHVDRAASYYWSKKDQELFRPLRLFRQGKDTLEIAQIMGISEAEADASVYRAICCVKRRKVRTVPHGELA